MTFLISHKADFSSSIFLDRWLSNVKLSSLTPNTQHRGDIDGFGQRPLRYISGVMQHVVGIQDAKMIIAINNNPQAAIFQTADLGVVSDFRQIVPLLIEELKKRDNPAP